jgi:hypothetical protein
VSKEATSHLYFNFLDPAVDEATLTQECAKHGELMNAKVQGKVGKKFG